MGFLDELLGTMENGFVALDALRWWQGLANLDVAIARGRFGGFDANGDDGLAAAGQIKSVGKDLLKFFLLGDDVVGGQNGHDACGRAGSDNSRAEGNGGAGVASDGFGDNVLFGQFGYLLAYLWRLHLIGDDEDVFDWHEWQDAVD